MKRLMLALAAVLALAAAPAAHADGTSSWPWEQHAYVTGKIVAVDATAGTLTADVSVVPQRTEPTSPTLPTLPKLPTPPALPTPPTPPSGTWQPPQGANDGFPGLNVATLRCHPPGSEPPTSISASAPQRVTITTDANTIVRLDDRAATLADLTPGEEFIAGFNAAPGSSLDQIVASPAVGIAARMPRVFYGFVGSVTSIDKTAGTLTVKLLGGTPATHGLAQSGDSETFTVGPQTTGLEFPNGFAHGSAALDNVSNGDIVAAGYLAPANETLSALLAMPLNVLVDFPLGGSGSGTTGQAQSRALKLAKSMVGSGGHSSGHHARKGKRHAAVHGRRK